MAGSAIGWATDSFPGRSAHFAVFAFEPWRFGDSRQRRANRLFRAVFQQERGYFLIGGGIERGILPEMVVEIAGILPPMSA